MVLELPPGPLMGAVNDLNQLWVMDIGLPGPAKAAGGKHLVLPPGYDGPIPDDVYVGRSTTSRVLVLVRALPQGKDVAGAIALMKSVKVYPLEPVAGWNQPTWIDLSRQADLDFTPVRWEDNLQYWQVLHDVVDAEPAYGAYRTQYGELAALGIAKGAPFAPDERMSGILTRAAVLGHAQLCVQSFADRRPDRTVWEGGTGNGRCSGRRTEHSRRRTTWICTPGRSGSTRRRSNPRRCSPAARAPDRCTGSDYVTPAVPT
nr:DUF1254 domain-containing protein [Rhodococcus pyridinivorans]